MYFRKGQEWTFFPPQTSVPIPCGQRAQKKGAPYAEGRDRLSRGENSLKGQIKPLSTHFSFCTCQLSEKKHRTKCNICSNGELTGDRGRQTRWCVYHMTVHRVHPNHKSFFGGLAMGQIQKKSEFTRMANRHRRSNMQVEGQRLTDGQCEKSGPYSLPVILRHF